jgi:hypothetical protein
MAIAPNGRFGDKDLSRLIMATTRNAPSRPAGAIADGHFHKMKPNEFFFPDRE